MSTSNSQSSNMNSNLFLCSAPRSGSTQLAAWLATHKDIGIASIKEPNYFAQHEFPEEYVRDVHLNDVDPAKYVQSGSKKIMQFAIFREKGHYEFLYRDLKERWRLDASTTYLHASGAAESILAHEPQAKVIILTRDPVARAMSHYRLAIRTGRTTRSLAEELEDEAQLVTPLPARFLLRQSRYDDAISAYKSVFPPDQIMVLAFEDVVKNPKAALAQVSVFLDVEPDGFDLSVREQNAGDAPRFGKLNVWLMQSGVKTFLRNALPRPIKRLLKPFYFVEADNSNDDADRDLIKKYLGG